MDGRATCANSCPSQFRQVPFSNGSATTVGSFSELHPSAEAQRKPEDATSDIRIPPCAVSANTCENSNADSELRQSGAVEPNAYEGSPPAARQVGESKAGYGPPSVERLSSAEEANQGTHHQQAKIHIMPPAAEQGGNDMGYPRTAKAETPWQRTAPPLTHDADSPANDGHTTRKGIHASTEPTDENLHAENPVWPMPVERCV